MKLHIPQTIIGSISVKAKNQGISFKVTTGELSDTDKLEFMKIQDMACEMMITPLDNESPDIKEVKSEVDKKPPSQRLRGVLYILYSQKPEGHTMFNTYYEAKMETLIEWMKGKIA